MRRTAAPALGGGPAGAPHRALLAVGVFPLALEEPGLVADRYAADASDADLAAAGRLPKSSIDAEFYELEAGRHVPPDRVWSAWPVRRPPRQ